MSATHISGWNDRLREQISAFRGRAWTQAQRVFALADQMMAGRRAPDLGFLLRQYICGVGSFADPTHAGLRRTINAVALRFSLAPHQNNLFDNDWRVRPELIQAHCPDLAESQLTVRPSSDLDWTQLLEPCPNELLDFRLPPPLGNLIRRSKRGPLWMYSTDDVVAYVHPLRYQLLSKDGLSLWASGSPRMLPRSAVFGAPTIDTDANLVIVQDRFEFRNFCHFLCEGISRVLLYIASQGISEKDLFVFGSIPGSYHELICAALSDLAGVRPENLFFPTEAVSLRTSKRAFWFSDQKEVYTRPAHMAHPSSIALLRRLCQLIPRGSDSLVRKIYISRADAARRRITNEPELIGILKRQGFYPVELSRLSASEQIGLFRNAETVIAPHGMGLTHILASGRLGRVIELFHPTTGAEDYAFLTKSIGACYDFLIGVEVLGTPGDISIAPDQVLALLGPAEFRPAPPAGARTANLIPGSKTFAEFSDECPSLPGTTEERMIWDQHTHVHKVIAGSKSPQSGRWRGLHVIAAKPYTASCWLWIPPSFEGSRIFIEVSEWSGQNRHAADLSCRSAWQRIWTTVQAPDSATTCYAAFRIDGPHGCFAVTTCWQFERGITPTAYASTP